MSRPAQARRPETDGGRHARPLIPSRTTEATPRRAKNRRLAAGEQETRSARTGHPADGTPRHAKVSCARRPSSWRGRHAGFASWCRSSGSGRPAKASRRTAGTSCGRPPRSSSRMERSRVPVVMIRVTFSVLPCWSTTSLTSGGCGGCACGSGWLRPSWRGNWLCARSSVQAPVNCGSARAATAPIPSRSIVMVAIVRLNPLMSLLLGERSAPFDGTSLPLVYAGAPGILLRAERGAGGAPGRARTHGCLDGRASRRRDERLARLAVRWRSAPSSAGPRPR